MKKIIYPEVTIKDIGRAYWRGTKNAKIHLIVAFLLFAFVEVINVYIPVLYKQFFDSLSKTPTAEVDVLLQILFTILALNVAWWSVQWFSKTLLNVGEARSIANLKQQSFEYLIRHSIDFFSNNFTGGMVSRVQRFAYGFERLSDTIMYNLIPLVINVGGAILITYFIEPLLSLVLGVWALLFIFVNYFYAQWRFKHNLELSELDTKSSGTLADSITNQSSVTLFSAFRSEEGRYKDITEKQRDKQIFLWNSNIGLDSFQNIFVVIVEFLVFFIAVRYWGLGLVSIGTFVLLQVYVIQIASKINSFGRIVRDVYEVHAQATEMLQILKLPHDIKDIPNASELKVKRGVIDFKEVTFAFNKTRNIFNKLSFSIGGGQKVGLVGASGAGKTTLIRLILRLYDVAGGGIHIDGENIKNITQNSLRNVIAFVPQEPVLFHRTLRENIAYGKDGVTDEQVIEAAKKAQAHDFISSLPDGYETLVGERGVKLSGGQRQRVAIARAILKAAPILVLDEATSSLDSESEVAIQKALNELMKGKTVIAIAHRLSTIRAMDRIIVLEAGKIVQDGTHDELLKDERGTYARLWNHQAGGFLQED